MRTLICLLCLCAVACGQAATVEGRRVEVGEKCPAGGNAVDVAFTLFHAALGPDKGLVASGYAKSNLPSEWYKVTLTIRFWDVYAERKDLFERACATVVIDRPKPGVRVKWRAILWSPHKEGRVEAFVHPKPIYTIHAAFTPSLPKRRTDEF